MNSIRNDDLAPREAVAEIEQMGRRVRQRSRWLGWVLLVFAVVDFAFFVAIGSADQTGSRALAPVPTLLAVGIFIVAARQPVIARDARRINRPVALAGLAATVTGLVLYQTVLPRGFSGWLILLAALMVVPYLVGSWRWLRA